VHFVCLSFSLISGLSRALAAIAEAGQTQCIKWCLHFGCRFNQPGREQMQRKGCATSTAWEQGAGGREGAFYSRLSLAAPPLPVLLPLRHLSQQPCIGQSPSAGQANKLCPFLN